MAVLGALIEPRDKSGVDSFRGNFVLNRLAKAFHQSHHKNNERDSDHHTKNGKKTAQLVRAHGVKRELKVFFEVLLHSHSLVFRAQSFDWIQPRGAHRGIDPEKQSNRRGKDQ